MGIYRDNQLNTYLESLDANQPVSNCCDAPMDEDEVLCPKCKERCKTITQGEYNYEVYEEAMCDRADAERELAREQ